MANSKAHSELLKELQDKGITDLDSLVKHITQDKTAAAQPRILLCNHNFCIVVKPR